MGIMMKRYMYETLGCTHVRIDIMLIDGQWFYTYHSSHIVTRIKNSSNKTIGECKVPTLIAMMEDWKLIGVIK